MCCPCRNSNTPTPPADNEENIPLSSGGGGVAPGNVVTSQPRRGAVGSTASSSGSIAQAVLNQPAPVSSRESCCSTCCTACLASYFRCLFPCCVSADVTTEPPEGPPEETPSQEIPAFLQEMEKVHGPIITKRALGHCSAELQAKIRSGEEVTQREKLLFGQQCARQKVRLQKELTGPLQDKLFEVANNPQTLPSPQSSEVAATKRGYETPRCYKPPRVFVITSTGNKNVTTPVNFLKLESQLRNLEVLNLTTGEEDILGQDGKEASRILQNTCFFLAEGATSDPHQGTSSGQKQDLILTEQKFLQLIILSLLATEHAPTDNQGRPPSGAMEQLKELMLAIRENAARQVLRFVTGGGKGASGGSYDNWPTPDTQRRLLEEAKKTHKSSRGILWN
ncbi:hypothetical protein [Chlamydia vaughanii]|uniref:hypothetical protein n=1 Tax=Chlamydia vaughanii TaxID=3112552 RepID=UPI0032B137DE